MARPKVLFLGLNYPPEAIGIAIYSGGLCEALADAGFDVQAVVARPYYPDWRVFAGFRGFGWARTREAGVDVTRIPLYVPAHPTGAKRILHHASFALSALPAMLARGLSHRPDVVITVAPSLVAAPVAALVARITGARCWLHVQDFEVGAAFATDLMRQDGRAGRLALGFERAVIQRFDVVSTISFEMLRRLRTLGLPDARIVEFRNWSDTGRVQPLDRPSAYRDRWAIATPHVALYSGNIANKQGIEILVAVARLLAHRRDLTFVICGEGPNRRRLEAQAAGLDNIRFHDLQPPDQLGELVGLATVHLLPQRAGAADLVLPSKLTNILASGRPVVATADPDTGLAREVAGCGLVVPPEQPEALARALERLLDDAPLRDRLGVAARRHALANWSKDAVLSAVVERMRSLARPPRSVGDHAPA